MRIFNLTWRLNLACRSLYSVGSEMLIEINIPIFNCNEDQKVFLSRLRELPNFTKVDTVGCKYLMTLTSPNGKVAIKELQQICIMWGTTFNRISD